MGSARSPVLVGRAAELRRLAETLDLAGGADASRHVLLGGDAGVGKTRLLTELRDRAVAHGWRVVVGHCLGVAESALPYLPFSEVLDRLAAETPQAVAEVLQERPALARLQPGRRLAGAETSPDSTVVPRALIEAVHALVQRSAASAPLLVVVEDVHWADRSTLDLLTYLFTRPFDGGRVAVVASYRTDDLHRRHPLRRQIAEWTRLPTLDRLPLEPLTGDDVRRLVRLLHPEPLPESDVAAIVSRAEGNAFFVEELVGTGMLRETLSDDLADVLLVRLDRLEPAARTVVRAAAVAGRRVAHDVLVEATGLDQARLDEGLREAVEGNVLVPVEGEGYAFRHALLAEAVYDDLLPGERVRLHTAYTRALTSGRFRGAAAELARHARLAGDLPVALRAEIAAGDEAAGVGGPDEAARHYLEALTVVERSASPDPLAEAGLAVVDLVLRAADALMAAGHSTRARQVLQDRLDRLTADASEEDRGRLLLSLAHVLFILLDDPDEPLARADQAGHLLSGHPREQAKALALRARILAVHGRGDDARQAGLEALGLAEKHDLPRLATDVLTTFAALDRDRPDVDAVAGLEEAVERARAAGAREAEIRARYQLGRFHQDRGEFAAAADAFAGAEQRGQSFGTPWAPYVLEARAMRIAVLAAMGAWDAALVVSTVNAQAPPAAAEALLVAHHAAVLAARGDQRALGLAEATRPQWQVDSLAALTAGSAVLTLHESRLDVEASLATYDELVGVLMRHWRPWFAARLRLAATVLGVLATAAGRMSAEDRTRRHSDAERLVADGRKVLSAHREEGIEFGPEGQAWLARLEAEWLRWRWAALVDPPNRADLMMAWQRAEEVAAGYGHVAELARVRGRFAAVLRATGEADEGRRLGEEVRATATALGARPILDELAILGAQSASQADRDDLTPREREILTLVAEGRTNGEIGRQLFISPKTVSVHVSRILDKLDATGRTEAAAIARRRGLVG